MATRTMRGTRRAGPRRKRVWARTDTDLTPAAGTNSDFDLLTAFESQYGAQLIGSTVVRVVGSVAVKRPTTVVEVMPHVIAGIHVGPQGLDADDHDPWDPGTVGGGQHLDWMWWRGLYVVGQTDTSPTDVTVYDVDVRSMRKLEELGETLWLCVSAFDSGDVVTTHWSVSTLVMLP